MEYDNKIFFIDNIKFYNKAFINVLFIILVF